MNVALYVRVSTDEQALKGYSIDAQEEALRKYVKENNYNIIGIYKDEGFSAKKSAFTRPAMQRLLADLDKIDLILFVKLDRWFRNIKEYYRIQEQLEKHNVSWKAILEDYDTSTADGRLKVNIMLSVAENEADRTSERIKFVFQSKINKGEAISGNTPFGYKVENKKLVKDDNKELVEEMFNHYLAYHSLSKLADHMRELGVVSTYAAWKKRLHNEIYTGTYKQNKNFCEPYITKEKHEKILSFRNVKTTPSGRVYLFTGMMTCPACGRRLTSMITNGIKRYRCPYHSMKMCDYKKTVRETEVEQYLIENIEELFKDEVFRVTNLAKKKPTHNYNEDLRRLNKIYMNGNIDDEEYEKKSKEIKNKIAEYTLTADEDYLNSTNEIICNGFTEVYRGLSESGRQSFWRNIIKEITFTPNGEISKVIFFTK